MPEAPKAPQSPPQATPPASPAPAQPPSAVMDDEKIFAVIGYLAFLFVVPLLVKPKSKFCQHHAKQSMIMFLLFIVILIVLAAVPLIGSIFTLGIFALYIIAIYRAYRGDLWNIPVISSLSGKIDVSSLYGKAGLNLAQLGALKEKAQQLGSKVTQSVEKLGKQEETKTPPPQPTTPPSSQPPASPPATK